MWVISQHLQRIRPRSVVIAAQVQEVGQDCAWKCACSLRIARGLRQSMATHAAGLSTFVLQAGHTLVRMGVASICAFIMSSHVMDEMLKVLSRQEAR